MHRRWDKSRRPTGPFAFNADSPIAQNVAAWFPFGAASGVKFAPDLVGNFHSVITGAKMTLGDAGQPAYTFDGTASSFGTGGPPVTAYPFSVSQWFRVDATIAQVLGSLSKFAGTPGNLWDWRIQLNTGISCATFGGGTNDSGGTTTSNNVVAGVWQHGLWVYTSATSRTAVLNGVTASAGVSTTNLTPAGIDTLAIGAQAFNSAYGIGIVGSVSELVIWNNSQSVTVPHPLFDPGHRFELWYPLRSRKWISIASGAPTVALTGNLATTSAGLVVPALSLAVSGNAATATQGTVAPGISLALTGNSATASQGTPVAALSLALTGNAATASAGTVGTSGNVALTGNAATATQGTVSPGITIALTGNGATASVGTLGNAISLALSGLAGTSSAGIVVPGLSLPLTGNVATATAGILSLPGSNSGIVQISNRTYVVAAQDRKYIVPAQDRTLKV